MARLKTVIHVHSDHSHDSNAKLTDIVRAAQRDQVDCVAITDHDDIRAAQALKRGGELRIIVGEEISTADGHLIGLFLQECIPPRLTAHETCGRIHEQGGLVLAPHPFATLCSDSLFGAMEHIAAELDAVEVCNAQNPFPWEDARASRFASRNQLTPYVGADAHIRNELSPCYQIMDDFHDPASFLSSLARAELIPGRISPRVCAWTVYRILAEQILRRPPPGFGVNLADRRDLRPASSRS